MANRVYPLARQRLLEWAFGVETPPTVPANIGICGVTSAYVYSDAHESLDDLTGVVAPQTALLNVTLTGGVIDADDPQIDGMEVGETLKALIIYAEWADANLLMAYMDTPGDGTLPQVINSPKGLVVFPPEGIFRF